MTFAYTVDKQGVMGDLRYAMGTFTNASGDTGGDIVTGLKTVYFASLQHTGAAVVANAPVINETFTTSTGTLTIVTDDNEDGIWVAYGKA